MNTSGFDDTGNQEGLNSRAWTGRKDGAGLRRRPTNQLFKRLTVDGDNVVGGLCGNRRSFVLSESDVYLGSMTSVSPAAVSYRVSVPLGSSTTA